MSTTEQRFAPSVDGTVENPLRESGLGELMQQLAHDTSTLVRQEIELAKAEAAQKGKQAGVGLGLISGAGVLALLATGTLTATFVAALDAVMPLWLAALVVTVVYLAIAGGLALAGKARVKRAMPPVPEKTVQTLKEDVTWAKTQMQSARR